MPLNLLGAPAILVIAALAASLTLAPTPAPDGGHSKRLQPRNTAAAEGGHDLDSYAIPPTLSAPDRAEARDELAFQAIIIKCMAGQGFDYWFTPSWSYRRSSGVKIQWWVLSLPPDQQAAAALALEGNTGTGLDYRWQDAGCSGYATHVTGNDRNN